MVSTLARVFLADFGGTVLMGFALIGFYRLVTVLFRQRKTAAGQSLVEISLLLPVLSILLFGTLDLGRLIQAQTRVTNAAHLAMRDIQNVENGNDTTAITTTAVQTAVAGNFPGVSINIEPSNPITISSNEAVTVTATSQFKVITPFVRNMVGQTSITQTVTGTTLP